MIPPEELIREWAYYQWERRGGGHGNDVHDWIAAEGHLKLAMNYETIAYLILNWGTEAGQVRYCGAGDGSGTGPILRSDIVKLGGPADVRKRKRESEAGQVRYWQYGQAENSPDLAISDLSRFLSPISDLSRFLSPISDLSRFLSLPLPVPVPLPVPGRSDQRAPQER